MRVRITIIRLIYASLFYFVALTAHAADLVQVYSQALTADPTLQRQQNTSLSQEQNVPINRANFLPTISAQSQYNRQNQPSYPGINPNSTSFSLDANQSIINAANWFSYAQAKNTSRAAVASDGAAVEDLIIRVSQAYFDVLSAQEQLDIDSTNQQALAKLLQDNQLKFQAGLVKTADVDNAQAAYEQSIATTIADQNNLISKQSTLQSITGVNYPYLSVLKSTLPLLTPMPQQLSTWLLDAEQYNLTVLADRYTAAADKDNIKVQYAGHLPTLTAGADYTQMNNSSPQLVNGPNSSVNLTFKIPLFAGGQVTAQTRQAAYNYQTQLSQLGIDLRAAQQQTQINYFGVIKSIAQIQADQAALQAQQKAYHSTLIAYHAGISNININSVITAEQNLYQSQLNLAKDRYTYIMNLLKLKQAAGLLSEQDVMAVNNWLQ